MTRAFRHVRRAFTLVELMLAMAIMMVLLAVVVAILSQIGRMWTQRQAQDQRQQNGRVLLDFIARDTERAILPLNVSDTNSLQFTINPPAVSASNRDNIFFQAPIASSQTSGEVAEIGYFVQWQASVPQLCRFFANPTDAGYAIYTTPLAWLSDSIVNGVAPATPASNYKGLLAEDVLGLWINAYDRNGVLYRTYDSRVTSNLPDVVDVSLIALDAGTALRLTSANVPTVQGIVQSSTDAAECMTQLPVVLRQGASSFTTRIRLRNSR